MTATRLAITMTLLVAGPRPAAAQDARIPEEVRGFRTTVTMSPGAGNKLSGELLAVTGDSLWVLSEGREVGLPFRSIETIKIRRHGLGPLEAIAWSVAGGVVTGALLTAACASVEDAGSCGTVFIASMASWLTIGLASASSLGGATVNARQPLVVSDLRRYARHPQGLPRLVPAPGPRVGVRLRLPVRIPG